MLSIIFSNIIIPTINRYKKFLFIGYLSLVVVFINICAFNRFSRALLKSSTQRFPRFLSYKMSSFISSEHIVSEHLLRQVNAWCGIHGLMYTDGNITWTPAPLALTPTPYPASAFSFVEKLQPIWNLLVDRMARDRDFLVSELSSVSHADLFTQRVLELYQSLPNEHIQDTLQLGILRSDYMLDYYRQECEGIERVRPLQVEINTISSSFGSLSQKVNRFHRDFLQRQVDHPEIKDICQRVHGSEALPSVEHVYSAHKAHESLTNIALALASAHTAYCDEQASYMSLSSEGKRPVKVLFIVQPGERNQGDQRALEQALWETHGIRAEFATLADISTFLSNANAHHEPELASFNRPRLLLQRSAHEPVFEVSVAYYRAGYTPQGYPSETEWQVRFAIEKSASVKCPSAGYHLAGAKAIQAALCKPGILERFFPTNESDNVASMAALRRCFAAQFALGDGSVKEAAVLAMAEACANEGKKWVLKPQREGGGNNFYNEDLVRFLKEHAENASVLDGFVLMQRIFPRTQLTAFYKQGKVSVGPSISELGIYGIFLGSGRSDPLLNQYAGYLLRTKAEGVDEGGVATGYSVLNSIYLTDN